MISNLSMSKTVSFFHCFYIITVATNSCAEDTRWDNSTDSDSEFPCYSSVKVENKSGM